jgi:outer membrane protein assembly factor BamB
MFLRLSFLTGFLLTILPYCHAADWPQWRGPERNEISKETDLNANWGAKEPRLLWGFEKAGSGYSGPAVVGSTLYCLGAESGKEFAFALDVGSGKELWRQELGKAYENDYGGGPRCTPTVDGDRLYVILGGGGLHCLDAKTGHIQWSKDFKKDFNGSLMSGWGFSESPLIDGDHLLCSPGGSGGTIVCLDKKSGKLVWRTKELMDSASYASIIAADVLGTKQYIQVTAKGVAGIAPKDGKLLWYIERPGHRVAVIPTAIHNDGYVYVTAGYGCGCELIKLSKSGEKFTAKSVYANKDMANQHGGVVSLDGYVYGWSGTSGRAGKWICQELKSGKVSWSEENKLEGGSLTCAGGRLYLYGEKSGTVVQLEASPSSWKEDGRLTIPKQSSITSPKGPTGKKWTHPVIANGKLYLRDQDLLYCYDLKP